MEMIKQRAEEVRNCFEGMTDDEIITKIADENERMEQQIDFLEEDNDRKEAKVDALEKEVEESEKRNDLLMESIEQISEENERLKTQIEKVLCTKKKMETEISNRRTAERELIERIEQLENINSEYARRHLRPRYADMDGGEDQIVIRKPERVQSISIYFKDE